MSFYLSLAGILAALMLLLPLAAAGFLLPTPPAAQSTTVGAPADQSVHTTSEPSSSQEEAQLPTADYSLAEPFTLYDSSSGKLLQVSQREYVLGALCAEMPPTFHLEALKAQAVAAHSYALCEKLQQAAAPSPENYGADFVVDTANWKRYVTQEQVKERFGEKYEQWYPKMEQAVDAVLADLLIWEGEPVVAAYHSMSNGVTESAENVWVGSAPYLTPVESEGDLLAPDYEVTTTFTPEELREKLLAQLPDITLEGDPSGWFGAEERSPSGYCTEVELGGQPVEGKQVRTALGLRSTDWTIDYTGGSFSITTRGYGHGVGLSQYGADYMARQGSDYAAILAHYYPGATLSHMRD